MILRYRRASRSAATMSRMKSRPVSAITSAAVIVVRFLCRSQWAALFDQIAQCQPCRKGSNGYLPIHEELTRIHDLKGLHLQTGAKSGLESKGLFNAVTNLPSP